MSQGIGIGFGIGFGGIGGGESNAFSPTNIPNLELWLEADFGTYSDTGTTPTTNGGNVKQWNDRSGNGRHVIAPAGRIPTLNTTGGGNSKPGIVFEGVTLKPYFDVPNFMTGFTAGEAFVVIKLNNDPPALVAQSGLDKTGNTANVTLYPQTSGVIADSFGRTTRIASAGDPAPGILTNWHIYDRISTATEWTSILNGTQLFTTGTNTVGWNTAPRIGGDTTAGSYIDGILCAWILFSRKLTTSEQTSMKNYLATKYAITVA